MKILLVKLSSLGDLIHCFPALSDLHDFDHSVELDWLVDGSFESIPHWHPIVNKTIAIPMRQWRYEWMKQRKNMFRFFSDLRKRDYDYIVDAQGLLKSAVVAKLARGKEVVGFDRQSIRKEKISALLYHRKTHVPQGQHAVDRMRQLFSRIFSYEIAGPPRFNVQMRDELVDQPLAGGDFLIGLHGASWASKQLPQAWWMALIDLVRQNKKKIVFLWSNNEELQRVQYFSSQAPDTAVVAPKLNINQATTLIKRCCGVISVDSGLAHIAAALGKAVVGIYGATDHNLTGLIGPKAHNIQSDQHCSPCLLKQCKYSSQGTAMYPPCYGRIDVNAVWKCLQLSM